jgi:hypothetical protein
LGQNDLVDQWPPDPDFHAQPDEVGGDLRARFFEVPFARVRRYADYWALRDIEADHVRKIAYRNGLSAEDRKRIEMWWLLQVDTELADALDRLRNENRARTARMRGRRQRWPRSRALSQIWFNTIGPGGRCWFGNRYTTLRHYTFMLHWRA